MKVKMLSCTIAFIFILTVPLQNVYASAPYKSYTYDYWGKSVPAPCGYLPSRAYTGRDMGAGALKSPQDMFVDSNNNVYVLDSGNNRVVILDSSMKMKKIVNKFVADSGDIKLNGPSGIFVDMHGIMYIADTENGRIVISDTDGKVKRIIGKPESDILGNDFDYKPIKVGVDITNTIYVLADGVYQGLMSFTEDGKFNGFYGSNKVEISLSLLADRLWKKILSKQQKEAMARYVPIEYSNLDISSDDFVYTTTTSTYSMNTDQLKKLNPMGVNILVPRSTSSYAHIFGDCENEIARGNQVGNQVGGNPINTTFVDIKADPLGFIIALDSQRGRVFQYDQECSLMFAFGGIGGQVGTFKEPVAVEILDGKILVLDSWKNSITSFYETEFGSYVRSAVSLYDKGRYEEAVLPWQEVLNRDCNYELAYTGLGKAYLKDEKYREAMNLFRLGHDRKGYLDAFKEYRLKLLRDNFDGIVLGLLAMFILIYLFVKRRKLYRLSGKIKLVLTKRKPYALSDKKGGWFNGKG